MSNDTEYGRTGACFYCGEPAAFIREKRLASPGDPDWIEVALERATQPVGLFIRAGACVAHDNALAEAIMERFGVAPGWKVLPREDCPDPFHAGVTNGESVVLQISERTWAEGYKCPSCGFQTLSEMPPIDPADAAYQFARATIDAAFGT